MGIKIRRVRDNIYNHYETGPDGDGDWLLQQAWAESNFTVDVEYEN